MIPGRRVTARPGRLTGSQMTETVRVIAEGPEETGTRLVLAHGASAPADSPFMNAVARGVAERGVRVLRFEFPYMERQRSSGRRHPPDPMPALLSHWEKVIRGLGSPETVSYTHLRAHET